jgi:2-dehydro-3-deoxyphosphogluconate aldolase/(4S)-4-hydroxy-2-oxoglutarate aldolase
MAALDLRLDVLKLFPAEACGGVATLKALAGPFPGVRFVPTGGISAANAASYLTLPSVAAVGGSWMVAPQLVRSGDFEAVTRLAREAVALVAEARS